MTDEEQQEALALEQVVMDAWRACDSVSILDKPEIEYHQKAIREAKEKLEFALNKLEPT